MSGRPLLLAGVDIGSTHCKAVLCRASGAVVARAQRPTPRSHDGRTHPADDLVAAALGVLSDCVRAAGRAPDAVGLTGMAEAGVGLDADGRPLGPVQAWSDPAPAPYAARLGQTYGAAALHARTGVLPSAKVPLAKWCAMAEQSPGTLARMRTWAGAADLVGHALTGRVGTDATLAQRTMAWDPAGWSWVGELLAEPGIGEQCMPRVLAPGEPVGTLTRGAAAATGLRPGIPVVVAGHDHLVGAWAAGVRRTGQVADSMGTAEAVLTVCAGAPDAAGAASEGMSFGRHADGRHWVALAGMQGSGALVEWFCDRFLGLAGAPGPERYAAFARLVETLPGEPTGLVVEPYLSGRASPRPYADARLAVHGLGAGHGPAHLARALLEGASHHARWMTDTQAALTGCAPSAVTLLGGSTRLEAWTRLKAAVSPWPVLLCEEPEAPGLGAAGWAGAALGLDPAAVLAPVSPRSPEPSTARAHRALHQDRFLPLVTAPSPLPSNHKENPS
ncbi:FGGY-family carbohydrate kinase [Streptomyces sp. NBC_01497]|uniref:FGGY-family carbohydrate kinase n=1 Tax=Streptomyces sp. NBC_01497 TaxID=2903885 RepID=UPI002E2FF337|nr:FGGY family carbohydrate kinase [Streptomyces sp. NBC_01497]